MIEFRHISILFVLLLLAAISFGQTNPKQRDLETWFSGQLRYRYSKEWRFSAEQQLRFKDISTSLDRMFTEVQAQYRPSRDFEFAIGMRDIIRNDNTGAEQGIVHQFRLHFDAALVMKIYQFDLTNRLRYQRRNEIGKSRAEGDHPIKDYRWKSTLVWNLENTKWKPKASAEFFYHAGIGELNGLRTVRYAIGADYRINKRQKLSFQYRRETDVVVWNPEVSHIFFVRYIHTIRKPKKKKAP